MAELRLVPIQMVSLMQECQVMGMRQVSPEHLCLAMCNTTHTGCIRALQECDSLPWCPCGVYS